MTKEKIKNKIIAIENIVMKCHGIRDILEDITAGKVTIKSLGDVVFTTKQKTNIEKVYSSKIVNLKELVAAL